MKEFVETMQAPDHWYVTYYFWPTMQVDARELVKKCNKCQRFGNVQRLPAEKLMTISSPWPFA